MKVILIQDVENLGKEGDIKEIADGYARNFLLPKNLVKLATKEALAELEQQKAASAQKAEEDLKLVQELVAQIDGQEIEIPVKIKEGEKIFGSITPLKIAQALKKFGFDIKKTQIKFEEPIKKMGEYPVIISFDHGLEAEIKLSVTEEREEEKK